MKVVTAVAGILFCTVSVHGQAEDPNQILYQGRVINQNGEPIEGACIDIYDCPQNDYLPRKVTHVGHIATNAEGRFSFSRFKRAFDQIEYSTAFVQADGYALQPENYSIWKGYKEIVLSNQTASLGGQVVDSRQLPIEGAVVSAFLSASLAITGVPALSCETDAQGHFVISGLPVTACAEFHIAKPGYAESYTFRTDDYWPEHQYAAGLQDILLCLKKEAGLSGQLLRSDTRLPLAQQTVSAVRYQGKGASLYTHSVQIGLVTAPRTYTRNDSITLETDSQGRFSIDHLVPGRYTVFHHNFMTGLFTPRTTVDVEEGRQTEIVIESVPGEPVAIQAAPDGHAPLPADLKVFLKRQAAEGEPAYEAFWKQPAQDGPDEDGRFHFIVLPGLYEAGVSCKTMEMAGNDPVFQVPASTYPALSLAAKNASAQPALQGVCLNSDGSPVEGARVYLLSDPNHVVVTGWDGCFTLTPRLDYCKHNFQWKSKRGRARYGINPTMNSSKLSAEYGLFPEDSETDWLGEDAYLMAISHDDSEVTMQLFYRHRDLQQGRKALKLVMAPACQITGQAIDGNGHPVSGAGVSVFMSSHSFQPESLYARTETDEAGRFSVSGLLMKTNYIVVLTTDAGLCQVKHFSAGLVQHGSEDVELLWTQAAGSVDMGTFLMDPTTYEVSGIVTNPWGRPISKARLTLNAPSQGIEFDAFLSRDDGTFVYDGLFAGTVELVGRAGDKGYARFSAAAGTRDIRLIIDKTIPSDQVGQALVPSAAVELSFLHAETREPVTLPEAFVEVQPENGNKFQIHLTDDGSARFLVGPGKITVKLGGVNEVYKPCSRTFDADLYQTCRFEFAVELTESRKILSEAATVIYPEMYSETTGTWNLRPRKEMDFHGILRVTVIDRQTEEAIANAEVLVSFDKGTGRCVGQTDTRGQIVFAVCENIFDPKIVSVTADGYTPCQPQEAVYADTRYPQEFTVEMERP